MNDCLIVGEAPSKTSDPRNPLMLPALAGLAGLQFPHQWAACFDRVNLLPEWPGPRRDGRGSHFPMVEAIKAASGLRRKFSRYRYVIFLGKRVAKAVHSELIQRRWFQWGLIPCDDAEVQARLDAVREGVVLPENLHVGAQCAVVPHPSRCSRWWDSPRNCLKARRWWTNVAREIHLEVI